MAQELIKIETRASHALGGGDATIYTPGLSETMHMIFLLIHDLNENSTLDVLAGANILLKIKNAEQADTGSVENANVRRVPLISTNGTFTYNGVIWLENGTDENDKVALATTEFQAGQIKIPVIDDVVNADPLIFSGSATIVTSVWAVTEL